MKLLSFLSQIRGLLVPEKQATYVCPHTGKTYYPGKLYDAKGNLIETETGGGDPYVGEIMLFGGNFAPNGWQSCEGQLLPISEYETLFVLIGTTYGGDGQTTFGLPDLRGRIPIGTGQGAGLSNFIIGTAGGTETTTITASHMPSYAQNASIAKNRAVGTPITGVVEGRIDGTKSLTNSGGGNQAVSNLPPITCVKFCIAVFGIFPSQS